MKKNNTFQLKITALSSEGFGIGRADNGIVVFVPFSAIGDLLLVKAVKVTSSVVYAKLLEVIEPSKDRIKAAEADCSAFGKCGGCDYRHITYEAELDAKQAVIHDAFTRIGKLKPEFMPIARSEEIGRYRNKAQYPIGADADGNVTSGFYSPRSHRIVPCGDCKLQPSVFNGIAAVVTDYVSEHGIAVYDEHSHSGIIRHVCVRKGHYSGEIVVCIVAACKTSAFDGLAERLMEAFSDIVGIVLNINAEKTNVIYGKNEIVLKGRADITDVMCGIKVSVSPRSFYQVNTPAAEMLYKAVAEFAAVDNVADKTVLDLYCGIGTIGLSFAANVKRLIGIELMESSVNNAVANAKLNGITNAEFICGDVSEIPAEISPDVVILDPARKGCERKVLEKVTALAPERIVMVSCNPATAARDCALLEESGYKTVKVKGFDLFPRTRHVECVVLLER